MPNFENLRMKNKKEVNASDIFLESQTRGKHASHTEAWTDASAIVSGRNESHHADWKQVHFSRRSDRER